MSTVHYTNQSGKPVEINDTPANRAAAEAAGWKPKKKAAKKVKKEED